MTLSPGPRRVLLIMHIAVLVGWMGAATAYIALNVPVVIGRDQQAVRAAFLMMLPVADYALAPLALATIGTGVALALGTHWGLLQHYWVTFSLLITILAAAVLFLHRPAVERLAHAASSPGADVLALEPDLVHPLGGVLVLCVPLVLNVVKPRGLTRRGWRVRQERRASTV